MYIHNKDLCNFQYQLVTAPALLPITVQDAKEQLNLSGNDDDVYIKTLINTATLFVEKFISRQLVTQTWALYADCFPYRQEIAIKKRPLSSVTTVEYYPSDWDKMAPRTTYAATNYTITQATEGRDAVIFRFEDSTWPDTYAIRQAVRIEFICGQAVADIPQDLKQAISMIVTFLFENRGDCCDENSLPGNIMALLQQYKRYNIGCCDG